MSGPMPDHAFAGPVAWLGKELSLSADWCRHFQPAEIRELEQAVDGIMVAKTPLEGVLRSEFPLPILGPVLARLRAELLHGRGFALLRGLPIATYTLQQVAMIFWGLGTHLGMPWAQNKHGHVLGDVTDYGRSVHDPNSRGYELGGVGLPLFS